MRVDGSIKTVTAGVTSLDDKRHNGTFAKIVDNWRCDPMRGLVKRPSSEFLSDIASDSSEDGTLFPIALKDQLFWVLIEPTASSQTVRVFDAIGNEQDVNSLTTSYFSTMTGKNSIAYVAIGDAIYIANKNVEVLQSNLKDIRNRSSMIVVKQAPAPYSKIDIQWTDSTGAVNEIPTLEVGDETEDRGTNTIAEAIADAMTTIVAGGTSGDNIYVQGSTILYNRADGDFASITGTDGARDAVIATINADTPDINNLGKYAGADCVVQIKPDPTSDRGSFYMRAIPEILTETDVSRETGPSNIPLSAMPFATLVCGNADEHILGWSLYVRGYSADPDVGIGSLTPPTWKGHTVFWMLQARTGSESLDNVPFQFYVLSENEIFPDDLEFMYLIDVGNGEVHTQTPMELVGIETDGSAWAAVWTGNGGRLWEDGQTFEVYDEYSDAIFGKLPEVRWIEAADPDALNYLDITTMPHILGIRGDGTWEFGPQNENLALPGVSAIRPRQAGDNDTNPMPTFISNTINDLGRFQDRLVVLSRDTISLSVTDKPHGWFRETATQQLAIDPIGMKSSAKDALTLNHIVSHNNDALIFSRNAQYKLVGSIGMTSQNAAFPQTTNYDNSSSAKPVSNASDVFFPIVYSSRYAGMSRFSVDRDSDAQDTALAVTNHIQRYIEGQVKEIVASSTLNICLVITYNTPNVIYVFEYVDSRSDPQAAWGRWILPEDVEIESIVFIDNSVRLGLSQNGRYQLGVMFLNRDNATYADRRIFLDGMHSQTGITTTITVPSQYVINEDNLIIIEGEGSPEPGRRIFNWTVAGSTITLPYSLSGGGVIYGYPFRSSYMPSRRWVRDDSGTPQTASKLRITDYGFWAYGTDINVDILDGPESWPTQEFTNDDEDTDAHHRISFKQRHDEADIEIWTENPFNTEILQLEWRGTYFKTGRRF